MKKKKIVKINKVLKAIKLVNKIQAIRSKNNKNWMDLVKLGLRLDFNKTVKIISGIYKYDNQIGKLTKKIKKLNF